MSGGPLPQYVEPFRLCDANAHLAGTVPAQRLQRIREFSVGQTADLSVDLRFRRDAEGRNRLDGSFDTVISTRCERCLEELSLPLHGEFALLLVSAGSDVPETSEDVDILEIEDERLVLATLLEEEVMLAVPDYPVHGHCEMVRYDRDAGASTVQPAEKANPFDALAALKKKD